jgi:ABC-type nickel/cobalt efflux system permease component RcnA
MRRLVMLAGLGLAVALAVLWLTGALGGLAGWIASAQRAAQDQLAGAIRSLRAGEAGALAGFWGICLGYGVLHAAGPGHGKLVIGGYGVARRVPALRLVGLALASSLAQAAVAVVLVYALVAVLGFARGAVEGAAEDWLTPFGHAMIAGLGLWLVWRGLRGLGTRAARTGTKHAHHDHAHHDHEDHDHGPHCTHAHGPTVEEVAKVSGLRDGVMLVAGIAARPCSGALFVLILTWQLGIALAGVIGAFVMGLGTALVTIGVALMAVWTREGALASLPGRGVARALPLLELGVGGVIAVAALGLLLQSL